MKKSLIALAVLAASGASFAQSSVTLYGVADVWFGGVKAGGVTQTKIDSGGVAASRFGFKGSEDLGGGLKANFLLEQGFNIDTGSTTTGQAFSRQSYVGFSGGFGEVKLGKMWTAYDDVAGDFKTVFNADGLAAVNSWASQGYQANPGNTVYYVSPNMGGFSAAVNYALGENKSVATATNNGDAGSIISINGKYAGGPVAAGLAYQTERPQGGGDSKNFATLRGSYDFGAAKLIAGYGRVELTNVIKSNDYLVGVDVPVSSALTLSAGYARSAKDTILGAPLSGDTDKSLGLAAAYSLSKRTLLYAGAYAQTTDKGVADNLDHDVRIYAVGVNHSF